jgi:hypothetical protein
MNDAQGVFSEDSDRGDRGTSREAAVVAKGTTPNTSVPGWCPTITFVRRMRMTDGEAYDLVGGWYCVEGVHRAGSDRDSRRRDRDPQTLGGSNMTEGAPLVEMIPIEHIHILNPRSRNKATFQDIMSNTSNVGLKKPITVARREQSPEGKPYDLACGQGRLEAYIALGQTEIPAIVIEATREECYLMSLIENA